MSKYKVKYTNFPSSLVSEEEKKSDSYGLKYAKAIEYEWFRRNGGSLCNFYSNRKRFQTLRKYAIGEQETKIYKKLLNASEYSYTNYDWRPIQVVPKFVNILSNLMLDRLFNVYAESTDKFSTDLKERYRQSLEDLSLSVPILKELKEHVGVDLSGGQDLEEVPRTKEEIDLYMQLNYKPALEIAVEEALHYTFGLNDFEELKKKLTVDIITLGIAGIRHFVDKNRGIITKYVDPENLVYSIPKYNDFRDSFYYGEVEEITIDELKRISNKNFSDEQLEEILLSSSNFLNYQGIQYDDLSRRNKVNVLHYAFKTTKEIVFKKKFLKNGGFKLIKKDENFKKPNNKKGDYEEVRKTVDVWYTGTYILGTDIVLNHGLMENMIRKSGLISESVPPYIVYAPEMYNGKIKSQLEKIIPYVDQMQQIHIKLQQFIAKARPSGIFIDIDGLNEIDLGDGTTLTPLEVIKIYDETGNVIGSSLNQGGEFNYGKKPITELQNGVVRGLQELLALYNHLLEMVRDSIGLPVGVDASTPHPDMAVGVQEQLSASSNTATRHILMAVLNITQRVADAIILELKDIFKYSNLKEAYLNAIGKFNVHILKGLNNFYLHDVGVNIVLKPSASEKQYLEQNLQAAISSGAITPEDAMEIRDLENVKLAVQVIKYKRKRKEELDQKRKLQLIQEQNKAAQQASIDKIKVKQIEASGKVEVEKMSGQNKLAEIEAEKRAKLELMEREFLYNMKLKDVEVNIKSKIENDKEDRKDKREILRAKNQAKINELKQRGAPAASFESSNDHLDGLSLGSFEPQ